MEYAEDDLEIRRFRLISVLFAFIYIVVWAYITLARYYSMNANVWDLGYAANVTASIPLSLKTLHAFITQIAYQAIAFLVYPVTLAPVIPAILLLQSILLGLSAIIVFEIGHSITKNKFVSMTACVTYLLYFPLAGVNWFDFHFQSLFVFLFLLGYLLSIKGHYVWAIVVFFMSGTVRFPYMGSVFLAALSLSIPYLLSFVRGNRRIPKGQDLMALSLMFISMAFVIFQYMWLTNVNTALVTVHSSANVSPITDLDAKLLSVGLLFAPLLFIPLFSKKWILPIIPFLFLVFFANNPGYEYPQVFTYWETSSVIPFLFLGLIDVLGVLSRNRPRFTKSPSGYFNRAIRKIFPSTKRILVILLMLSMFLALFLQPYGPLNGSSFNNFELSENTKVNMTLFDSAQSVMNLVPQNEKYVLLQNNLPQFFPRVSIQHILVSPYNIGPNVTQADIASNTFPFNGISQEGVLPINYVILDLNNPQSLTAPSNTVGYPTMLGLVSELFSSGYYGIMAEAHGIILLKRNYTSGMKLFSPYDLNYGLSSTQISTHPASDVVVHLPNAGAGTQWFGDWINLGPGRYSAVLSVASGACSGNITVAAGYAGNNSTFIALDLTTVSVCSQNGTSSFVPISFNFTFSGFIGNVQFSIYSDTMNQTIVPTNLAVHQISVQQNV